MFANIPVYLYKNNPKKNWNGEDSNCCQHEYINVLQGENNSEILNFHLFLDDSTPLDLTDKTVTFYFTKPDGTKIFLQADIPQESAPNGIALVTLTAQCTAVSGLTKNGVIRVTYPDNSVLKFPTPNLYIASSNYENAIKSTSEFHALDIAINKTQEALNAASDAIKTSQSILQMNQNTITEQINSQKDIAGGLATLNAQKKLVQMPTAADVGATPEMISGNWTPILKGDTVAGSPTFAIQPVGKYYKFGKLVIINLNFELSNKGGMAGRVRVFGLPFTIANYGSLNITSSCGFTPAINNALVLYYNNAIELCDASNIADYAAIWASTGFYICE
jgi:hypothetical protein